MTGIKEKKLFYSLPSWICVLTGGIFLIKFRDIAAVGAYNGLNICYEVILPCVFPFMIISGMFVSTGMCRAAGSLPGSGILKKLFAVSSDGLGVIFLGLCGGYPSGAYAACELYKAGTVSENEAQRLILYTNNATPAFIIGYVGSCLGSTEHGLFCWVCVIFSSFLCGAVFRKKEAVNRIFTPADYKPLINAFTGAVAESTKNTVIICGYIIVFSIISCSFRTAGTHGIVYSAAYSVLEITGGIAALAEIIPRGRILCALYCAVCSFSGLCVFSQIASACCESKIDIKLYIPAKLFQSVVSFAVSFIFYNIFFG